MGLVLPPLLTIMDDYETTYRDHGLRCLETLLDKVNATTLKRMGIDKLFLKASVAWQLGQIDRALISYHDAVCSTFHILAPITAKSSNLSARPESPVQTLASDT